MRKVLLVWVVLTIASIGFVYSQDSFVGGKSSSSKGGIKATVIEDGTSLNILTGSGSLHSVHASLQVGDAVKIWDCTDASNIAVFSAYINDVSDGQINYTPSEPTRFGVGLYVDATVASNTTSSIVLQWEG